MTSRLDRLFILLESGSSAVTRRAAAKQIGEVQHLYPHELHNLLNRLINYLHSQTWETRIAAAQAIEAVLNNVPQWDPMPCKIKNEVSDSNNTDTISTESSNLLSFKNFNLSEVLQKGKRLMGSEGLEFDNFDDSSDSSNNSNDRLIRQRALLNEKLGITQASKLGIAINEMISDEDMNIGVSSYNINDQKVPVQDILKMKLDTDTNFANNNNPSGNMSCREINRARRKARQGVIGTSLSRSNSTNSNNNGSNSTSLDEPERKKPKLDDKFEVFYDLNEPVPDATGSWNGYANSWPLEQFCKRLYLDLFNPRWEIRHGSATALRELLNSHSAGAGKSVFMTEEEMETNHNYWLEDATLRLLCVLSLDRFGDFVSDQVVAPVRETSAQVLGTVLKEMPKEKVREVVTILLALTKQTEWEVRHGGLLGLKYLLVVREDLLPSFLPLIINDVLMGLLDEVDDVGAVAASTLIPVASWLPKLLNEQQVSNIVEMLWNLLLNQDELTSACNSFMGLLAAILSLPDASNWIKMEPLSILIPRLWPFLSHSTSSVRRSTLQTLKTLTDENRISNGGNMELESLDNKNEAINNNSNSINLGEEKQKMLNFGVSEWKAPLLQEALRHIYQRVLVEPNKDIQEIAIYVWMNLIKNAELSALLHAACPYVSAWICLAMQPARLAFDPSLLIFANKSAPVNNIGQLMRSKNLREDDLGGSSNVQPKLFLGGNEATPQEIREKNHVRARTNAAKILGALSKYLVKPAPGIDYTSGGESPINCYTKVLMGHLESRSSLQRLVCSLIISFWAEEDPHICPGPIQLQEKLKYCVMEYIYYDEVAVAFTRLLQESHDFIATLKQYQIPVNNLDQTKVLTLDQINSLVTTMSENIKGTYNLKPKISDIIEERRKSLQNSLKQTSAEQNSLNLSTQAALAGAIVSLNCLPEKLNPVVKPLMESLKREECELLQQLSSMFLVKLLDQVSSRLPSPNNKIVNNLCALLKSDPDYTPQIKFPEGIVSEKYNDDIENPFYGILSLSAQQKTEQNGIISRGPGRPPINVDLSLSDILGIDEPYKKLNRIQRIGAKFALTEMCEYFGETLFAKIPALSTIVFTTIDKILETSSSMDELRTNPLNINKEQTGELMTSLQVIEVISPYLHKNLHENIFKLLPKLGILLTHPLKAIRNMVSRCFAAFSTLNDCKLMNFIIDKIIPLLETAENIIYRQGAAETIDRVVDKLQFKMVPYVVLLVVPLLGRMSDLDESVRLMSTHCFATLIQLMPLDSNKNCSFLNSTELEARKIRDREFLEYLFKPKTIPDFKVPVSINAELRSYQQAGVNWLWFLNKYNLHGILCDDMGLGKTLQTICILAGDHYDRKQNNLTELPSIVICPPTLTGHWVYEIQKFLPSKFLNPLHYVGLPNEREKLRPKLKKHNLIVASYDTIRKDVDFFSKINWNYCVLDEGHIIKNGKTKSSKAIKQLKANHRLILSGTPIQNNVLELWSLFDFLMPGFLGTEKQFLVKFSRPILASRDAKSSTKEQESGVLAMEALHRQVLPFLLRRVKEDVLKDLPPKITQDLICELSPLQERLYEDFSRTHLNSEIKDCIEHFSETESTENLNKKTHIFQALRYLQNVCNHPKLILNEHHPEYQKISEELARNKSSLDDIEHSAKLPALKQLLLDCGIGIENETVSQHRALIFCQLKTMLDIVEKDLLKKHMPTVSYLRLDGTVPASSRHEIVTKFNGDPSIDVLLLTTQVGGLGLNLTGADTVIFVEHDWNPMKDLQAMDRAHRIGQKKVVNVYRLITRKSLEEKIMGLQKFKILTANTIVGADNASLETMGTDQLLDLFNLHDGEKQERSTQASSSNSNGNGIAGNNAVSMKTVIENLPDLWEDRQYEEEYDLTQFVKSLKK
ncbi:TATA-binding protein-associated factor 172 [Condylostylus longicornis]|uniref:TATA-binding protein-associated factor 172 n=1 Tax=Condylostylus longicornis TaxID=2530218 RepID=UPI00244E2EDE|nr:TATA-binding protein-associated factor 172 [Condylostylus longicornis]